ncbi:carboxylesterase family protein-like protein [Polychaeton citri CBS 116435]|uniref:Carboxylic ester hydrolase n=1 Tax=Polychaeton citri CBS 116435 TaxID=1314669 RepID=A0A9P4QEW8_9PEZI|nr:carboxylesterase family protein-like protein [Polychaeton citri CBS 116435]
MFSELLVLASAALAVALPPHGRAGGEGNRQHHGPPTYGNDGPPTVHLKNGSYTGVHNSHYNQDFFLGVPFAQPPVEGLRFRNPASLNTTWTGTSEADAYASECVGYGGDQIGYDQSEDCLYLNIIRPAGYEGQALPLAVWIHGGGYYMGGTADKRYNLSFIVENSVEIGKPIMAASIAYRLGPFGFLNGQDVEGQGVTNLGLKDQRLALHWFQENLEAFGGDPTKVTIWGESAGASSIGRHLTAYNGRDDHLFRAAIMESGNPIHYTAMNTSSFYQPRYEALIEATNCSTTTDTLDCLRRVPFEELNSVLNTTQFNTGWTVTVDGDMIARYGSEQLADGSFVRVPIIDGANSDEGTAFSPQNINSEADFASYLNTTSRVQQALPPSLVDLLLDAYPDDCCAGIPSLETLGGVCHLPDPYGYSYRRAAAYFGDEVFIANRRQVCETWAAAGLTAYCYRFNAIPAGISWPISVTHFQEVAFVFNNLQGLGYAVNAFEGKGDSYTQLSELMSKSWASFVADGNVSGWAGRSADVPDWPKYDVANPRDLVFDANVTSFVELDTYREEGMRLLNENMIAFRR